MEMGFRINCMGIVFDADALHRDDPNAVEKALDEVQRASQLGISLGASVTYLVPGKDGSKTALAKYANSLAEAAERAQKAGSILCVEHFPGLSLPTALDTLDFLEAVDHSNLYLLLDLGHLQISKEDPVEIIERAGERLGYVHLDDNDGVGDLHLPLLQGVMKEDDLQRTLVALDACGYDKAVSLELSPKLANPLQALSEGYEIVSRLLTSSA